MPIEISNQERLTNWIIVGISTTAIDNNIARLKELKILRRVGSDKGGYWEVIEKI